MCAANADATGVSEDPLAATGIDEDPLTIDDYGEQHDFAAFFALREATSDALNGGFPHNRVDQAVRIGLGQSTHLDERRLDARQVRLLISLSQAVSDALNAGRRPDEVCSVVDRTRKEHVALTT
jgi:hypothetical protein